MVQIDHIFRFCVSLMEHDIDLKALADFNLVVRHGSFNQAALAAHRPKATLSRHVRDLESALGVRLLERGGRRPQLTEEGRALHERTAHLLTEIEETAHEIAAYTDRPRGRLRISAPFLFSQAVLGRLTAEFVLQYPEVTVDVTAEDRNVDMIKDRYDLAIRVNPDRDATLIGRCFLHDRRVVVAARPLALPAANQTVRAVLLGASDGARTWKLRSASGVTTLRPEPVLRLSSLHMMRDAVRVGAGAAVLPLSMVANDLATGRLVAWGDLDVSEVELWALYPSRRLLSRRVSAFLDHLRGAFPNAAADDLARYMGD